MVGIIDSGIGGLFVLHKCMLSCPNLNYIYFADNLNLPYGNKGKEWLINNAFNICDELIKMGVNVIIFACNTLTASAIKRCRQKYKHILFIGIEPAVKPASESGLKTLVLCTTATYKTSAVIKKYKCDKFTYLHFKNLAYDIENSINNKYLEKYFNNVVNFDAVVLGCTHFNYIKKQLTQLTGAKVFFEASDGVAKRLKSLCLDSEEGILKFVFSGKNMGEKYTSILKNLKNFK